jgi:hypothetical protein
VSIIHFDTMPAASDVTGVNLSGTSGAPRAVSGFVEYTSPSSFAAAQWSFSGYDTGSPNFIKKGYANKDGFNNLAYAVFSQDLPDTDWIIPHAYTGTYYFRVLSLTGDDPAFISGEGAPPYTFPTAWVAVTNDNFTLFTVRWLRDNLGTDYGVARIQVSTTASTAGLIDEGYYSGLATVEGGCFTGDMRVMVPGGELPIAEIIPGHEVMCVNTETNELEVATVETVMAPRVCNIYEVRLSNGKVIETTAEHPFRTASGKWVSIDPDAVYTTRTGKVVSIDKIAEGKMEEGMMLYGADKNARVTGIVDTGRTETVYNLSRVGPYKNYIVEGMCVHNIVEEFETK